MIAGAMSLAQRFLVDVFVLELCEDQAPDDLGEV